MIIQLRDLIIPIIILYMVHQGLLNHLIFSCLLLDFQQLLFATFENIKLRVMLALVVLERAVGFYTSSKRDQLVYYDHVSDGCFRWLNSPFQAVESIHKYFVLDSFSSLSITFDQNLLENMHTSWQIVVQYIYNLVGEKG